MADQHSSLIMWILGGIVGVLLILSFNNAAIAPYFGGALLVFLGYLASALWRKQRSLNQIEFSLEHYLVDTNCFLAEKSLENSWSTSETERLLADLIHSGPQDARTLAPSLEKLTTRLKNSTQQNNHNHLAFLGWAWALRSQVNARENLAKKGRALPKKIFWQQAVRAYEKAILLNPTDFRLRAEYARALETHGQLYQDFDNETYKSYLLAAQENYETALKEHDDFPPAWHGQGRVWAILANFEKEEAPARQECLFRALSCYEKARSAAGKKIFSVGDGEFYREFAALTTSLAELTDGADALHYAHYGARLYLMALDSTANESSDHTLKAALALHQVAILREKLGEDTGDAFTQALTYFRQVIAQAPLDALSRRKAVQCLLALFHLPSQTAKEELLSEAVEHAAQLAQIAPVEESFSEWANVLSLLAERASIEEAPTLWSETALRYGQAASFSDILAERAAVNWHNWGYALATMAELAPSIERRRNLWLKAIQKYETAAQFNNNNLITLQNWADILGELSNLEAQDEQEKSFLVAAEEKYLQAIELYPQAAGPWRRWSGLLRTKAKKEPNPNRRKELCQLALDMLEKGVAANENDPMTWVHWGNLLSEELCCEGSEAERAWLLAQAIEKYERALVLEPKNDEFWCLLGRARLEATECPSDKEDPSGIPPLKQAYLAAENFERACQLNADDDTNWAEWGRALFKIAFLLDNEASSLAAIVQAEEKYRTALALNPSQDKHHISLGHILYQWGWHLEELDDRRLQFQKAYKCWAEAGRLAPHEPKIWRDWARVTEALASLDFDPQTSASRQIEAEEKYYQAVALETPGFFRH